MEGLAEAAAASLVGCRARPGRDKNWVAVKDLGIQRDCFWASSTVDSQKLEYGCGVIYAGLHSICDFGIRGRSYSNFLASTVGP